MAWFKKVTATFCRNGPNMVQNGDSHLLPKRPEGCFAQKVAVTFLNLSPFLNHA
jgi:hypothetical protein